MKTVMMTVEMLVILSAVFMEGVHFTTGDPKSLTRLSTRWPTLLRVIMGLAGYAYLGLAFLWWLFSSHLPVQLAGLTLIVLSGIALIRRKRLGEMAIKIDAGISLVCLLLVAYFRLRTTGVF